MFSIRELFRFGAGCFPSRSRSQLLPSLWRPRVFHNCTLRGDIFFRYLLLLFSPFCPRNCALTVSCRYSFLFFFFRRLLARPVVSRALASRVRFRAPSSGLSYRCHQGQKGVGALGGPSSANDRDVTLSCTGADSLSSGRRHAKRTKICIRTGWSLYAAPATSTRPNEFSRSIMRTFVSLRTTCIARHNFTDRT